MTVGCILPDVLSHKTLSRQNNKKKQFSTRRDSEQATWESTPQTGGCLTASPASCRLVSNLQAPFSAPKKHSFETRQFWNIPNSWLKLYEWVSFTSKDSRIRIHEYASLCLCGGSFWVLPNFNLFYWFLLSPSLFPSITPSKNSTLTDPSRLTFLFSYRPNLRRKESLWSKLTWLQSIHTQRVRLGEENGQNIS